MSNINQTVSDRINQWDIPQDVAGIISDTDISTIAELYGDIETADELVKFVRENQGYWYAVQMDEDDTDWGTGSYDKVEAIEKAEQREALKIAVIEMGDDPTCIAEIYMYDAFRISAINEDGSNVDNDVIYDAGASAIAAELADTRERYKGREPAYYLISYYSNGRPYHTEEVR